MASLTVGRKEHEHKLYLATVLVGMYVACQIVADVLATKIGNVFGVFVPLGSIVFALTFTLRDSIHRKLGKRTAINAIWIAALANIFMVLWFAAAVWWPPAPFWRNQEAFASVLGVVWHIVAASIVAELVSELADTLIFHKVWWREIAGPYEQGRHIKGVVLSNLVSCPLDSIVFGGLAFWLLPLLGSGGHLATFPELVSIIIGQTILKYLVSMVILPVIAFVRR